MVWQPYFSQILLCILRQNSRDCCLFGSADVTSRLLQQPNLAIADCRKNECTMRDLTTTLLPYTKITHNGQATGGWVVVWDPIPRKPPVLGNIIALGKDGIGTVVIRDGLKCPGVIPARRFVSLVSIPVIHFAAVSGTGYKIEIRSTNPKGPKTWTFDLNFCCGIGLHFLDGTVTVSMDPGYTPTLS
jgi:hypothetical protein